MNRIFFLLISTMVFSQSISNQLIGSSGNLLINLNEQITFSIGEPVIGLMNVECYQLNNGFYSGIKLPDIPVNLIYYDLDGDGFGSNIVSNLCASLFNELPPGYSYNNTDCNDTVYNLANSCNTALSIKLFIQGYYTSNQQMAPLLNNAGVGTLSSEVDAVTISLYSPYNTTIAIATGEAMLDIDGFATVQFNPTLLTESQYYIAIQHKNAIKTWSATPVAITNGTTYDFTTAASQAYGNNQIEVAPGIYAIYSGDMNQDGTINEADLPIFTTANTTAAHGYLVSDLNGDGSVDLLDYPIYKNNAASSVNEVLPLPLPVIPTLTTTEVSNITTTAAITGGTITSDGGANVTARGIVWSTSPSPTIAIATKTTDGTGTGTFTSTLTGLAPATTYYVRAYATNVAGTAYGNEITFITFPTIGQAYQGGVIAYIFQPGDYGHISGEFHGIISAASDQIINITWNWAGSNILTGASGTALGTGNTNTNKIVNGYGNGNYAAKLCFDLVLNGYSDWYLPSSGEMSKMILNKNAIGGFSGANYWSSSEFSSTTAYYSNFTSGSANLTGSKNSVANVRAVRRF